LRRDSEGLVENELFGHERGAYTGAGARKIGKLELAHRGTLFLDENRRASPRYSSKLLRVLEEKAIRARRRNAGNRSQRAHLDCHETKTCMPP